MKNSLSVSKLALVYLFFNSLTAIADWESSIKIENLLEKRVGGARIQRTWNVKERDREQKESILIVPCRSKTPPYGTPPRQCVEIKMSFPNFRVNKSSLSKYAEIEKKIENIRKNDGFEYIKEKSSSFSEISVHTFVFDFVNKSSFTDFAQTFDHITQLLEVPKDWTNKITEELSSQYLDPKDDLISRISKNPQINIFHALREIGIPSEDEDKFLFSLAKTIHDDTEAEIKSTSLPSASASDTLNPNEHRYAYFVDIGHKIADYLIHKGSHVEESHALKAKYDFLVHEKAGSLEWAYRIARNSFKGGNHSDKDLMSHAMGTLLAGNSIRRDDNATKEVSFDFDSAFKLADQITKHLEETGRKIDRNLIPAEIDMDYMMCRNNSLLLEPKELDRIVINLAYLLGKLKKSQQTTSSPLNMSTAQSEN